MRYGLFVSACLAIGVAGCSENKPTDPDFPQVTGKVTLNGQPLPKVIVTFLPIGDNLNNYAEAETDAEGQYNLKGPRGGMGTGPGTYAVAISAMRINGQPVPPDVPLAESGAVETLPPRYSDRDKTKLKATVPEGGGVFNFDLRGP